MKPCHIRQWRTNSCHPENAKIAVKSGKIGSISAWLSTPLPYSDDPLFFPYPSARSMAYCA